MTGSFPRTRTVLHTSWKNKHNTGTIYRLETKVALQFEIFAKTYIWKAKETIWVKEGGIGNRSNIKRRRHVCDITPRWYFTRVTKLYSSTRRGKDSVSCYAVEGDWPCNGLETMAKGCGCGERRLDGDGDDAEAAFAVLGAYGSILYASSSSLKA